MPEGNTVYLAAKRLDAALRGETITASDFRVPRYATVDLSGRIVRSVTPTGKHLLFDLGDVTLHTHFRMQGSWHLYRSGERWKRPAHQARVVLTTDKWVAVGFDLPVIELVRDPATVVSELGPDLMSESFDLQEAIRRLRRVPSRPVGEALVDQRVVAGLGNVYRSEVCFLLGIDPATPVEQVDAAPMLRLARRMIQANRTRGSQITTGDLRPRRSRWVYGRGGSPCYRCGTTISSSRDAGGRVVYSCPSCQPSP